MTAWHWIAALAVCTFAFGYALGVLAATRADLARIDALRSRLRDRVGREAWDEAESEGR